MHPESRFFYIIYSSKSMSNRSIRHHYVSNFLCKNFSTNKKTFYRFEFATKKILKLSVRDGFVKNDLYTVLDKAGQKSDALEKLLGEIEAPAAKAISTIIERIGAGKDIEDVIPYPMRLDILNFCILSHSRTPKNIIRINLMTLRMMYAASYLHLTAKKMEYDASTFTLSIDPTTIMLNCIAAGVKIFPACLDLTATIVFHESTSKRFVLPDQPVVLEYTGRGEFTAHDLKILFPVSSHILMIFSRGESAEKILKIGDDEIDAYNTRLCASYYGLLACESEDYLKYFSESFPVNPTHLPTNEEFEREKEVMKNEVIGLIKESNGKPFELLLRSSKDGIEFYRAAEGDTES